MAVPAAVTVAGVTQPDTTAELLAELRALRASQARLERVIQAIAEVLPMRFRLPIRRALNDPTSNNHTAAG